MTPTVCSFQALSERLEAGRDRNFAQKLLWRAGKLIRTPNQWGTGEDYVEVYLLAEGEESARLKLYPGDLRIREGNRVS